MEVTELIGTAHEAVVVLTLAGLVLLEVVSEVGVAVLVTLGLVRMGCAKRGIADLLGVLNLSNHVQPHHLNLLFFAGLVTLLDLLQNL